MPKEVGYLLGLVSLYLSRNILTGEIPSDIGNLSSLYKAWWHEAKDSTYELTNYLRQWIKSLLYIWQI